jgi:hypothetical protein
VSLCSSSHLHSNLQAFICLCVSSRLSRLAMIFLRAKSVMRVTATRKAMTKTIMTPTFLCGQSVPRFFRSRKWVGAIIRSVACVQQIGQWCGRRFRRERSGGFVATEAPRLCQVDVVKSAGAILNRLRISTQRRREKILASEVSCLRCPPLFKVEVYVITRYIPQALSFLEITFYKLGHYLRF